MADTKITALTALTGADPANDVIPIVDVSDTTMAASGTTKKISVNNILGASGTATLASATITGDLTVDTSTLKVDSANNRVGIGTASPAVTCDVAGPIRSIVSGGTPYLYLNNGTSQHSLSNDSNALSISVFAAEQMRIAASGVFTWYDGAGGTRMTLNSTGLGVGGPPAAGMLLTVGGTSSVSATANALQVLSSKGTFNVVTDGSTNAAGTTITYSWANGGQGPLIFRNAAISNVMTLDASGNCGIGVTPSAWSSGIKVLEFGTKGGLAGSGSDVNLIYNAYYDGSNKYRTSDYANNFQISGGQFKWLTAPSGTAGNVITYTQAMTLTAGGDLLVGKSSVSATTIGFEGRANGTVNSTLASSVDANATYAAYSTGAAAYRFYVGMGGTVYATNTTISAISDARLKENVQDIDVGLGAILALKPRKFDWKAGKGKDIKGDRGFIAQEFEQVFPQLVDEWKDEAPEGEAPYKSVRQDLIPVLVKAIQELAARVQTLETR